MHYLRVNFEKSNHLPCPAIGEDAFTAGRNTYFQNHYREDNYTDRLGLSFIAVFEKIIDIDYIIDIKY